MFKLKTQFSEVFSWVVHLSGPCRKIRTAQGVNQRAPFQRGPVQPYNNISFTLPSNLVPYDGLKTGVSSSCLVQLYPLRPNSLCGLHGVYWLYSLTKLRRGWSYFLSLYLTCVPLISARACTKKKRKKGNNNQSNDLLQRADLPTLRSWITFLLVYRNFTSVFYLDKHHRYCKHCVPNFLKGNPACWAPKSVLSCSPIFKKTLNEVVVKGEVFQIAKFTLCADVSYFLCFTATKIEGHLRAGYEIFCELKSLMTVKRAWNWVT